MKNILCITLAMCISLSYAQDKRTWEGLSFEEYPFIKGGISKAERYSYQKSKLTIYISGQGADGNPEPYNAREYAKLLCQAFGSKDYTKYPTEIIVFYEESYKDRFTAATVVINGEEFYTKNGTSNFTPLEIAGYIDVFTKRYYEVNGLPLQDH